jgi:hypothetical protein
LRDILSEKYEKASDIPFGGKVVVLGGDPKQILPVIENGSKSQIINALILRSYLWNHVTRLYLTENMRLQNIKSSSTEYVDLNNFNNWILDIGNGIIKNTCNIDDDTDSDSITVQIPEDLLIHTTRNKIEALAKFTYPNFETNFQQPEYLKDRAQQIMKLSMKSMITCLS